MVDARIASPMHTTLHALPSPYKQTNKHQMAETQQHTVFFHPDLGIGGAERLVVDAAVALQSRGHRVTIFTSHCDPRHCFDEARDGKPPLCARRPTAHRSYVQTAAET